MVALADLVLNTVEYPSFQCNSVKAQLIRAHTVHTLNPQERILNLQRKQNAAEQTIEEEHKSVQALRASERSAVERATRAQAEADRLVEQLRVQERALDEARSAVQRRQALEEQLAHLENAQKEVGRMHTEERRMVTLQKEEMQHVVSRLEDQLAQERQVSAAVTEENERLRHELDATMNRHAEGTIAEANTEVATSNAAYDVGGGGVGGLPLDLPAPHGTIPMNVVHSLQQELSTVRRSLIDLQKEIHEASPAPPASAVRRSLSPPASARSPSKALATIDRLLAIQDGRAAPSPGRLGEGGDISRTSAEDVSRHWPPPSPAPAPSPARPTNGDAARRHAQKVSFGFERPAPDEIRSSSKSQGGTGGGTYTYDRGLIDLVDQLESPSRTNTRYF